MLIANQTAKHSLKHYANMNVFQKAINGSFKRKVTVEEAEENSVEDVSQGVGRNHFASLASSVNGEEFEISKDPNTNVVHLKTEIENVGRRTQ